MIDHDSVRPSEPAFRVSLRDLFWLLCWVLSGMLISFAMAAAAAGQQPLMTYQPQPGSPPAYGAASVYIPQQMPVVQALPPVETPTLMASTNPVGAATVAPIGATPAAPMGYPFSTGYNEPIVTEDGVVIAPDVCQPAEPRGLLQKASLTFTYLPRGQDDDVGFVDFEGFVVLGLPLPSRESPTLITPVLEVHGIDGPVAPDLPARVYDEYIEFRHIQTFSPEWKLDMAISPGMHNDRRNLSSEGFRLPGYIVGIYSWVPPPPGMPSGPQTTFVFGAAFLDREDATWIPAGGIIWIPNDDWRFELVTPRPKIAKRVFNDCHFADWIYTAAEFGGGEWAIERTGGIDDVATASDFRFIVGYERKSNNNGPSGRVEAGYVFGRQIEYKSGTPSIEPDDTLLVRTGVWF